MRFREGRLRPGLLECYDCEGTELLYLHSDGSISCLSCEAEFMIDIDDLQVLEHHGYRTDVVSIAALKKDPSKEKRGR